MDRQRDGCPVCGGPCPDERCQCDPDPASVDELRSKLAGWHLAKELLAEGELEILTVAEAVLAELDRRDANGYAR